MALTARATLIATIVVFPRTALADEPGDKLDHAMEPEHGLQIVFKDGQRVNKVGPFNGPFTNSHAYADPSLEGVIYRPRGVIVAAAPT